MTVTEHQEQDAMELLLRNEIDRLNEINADLLAALELLLADWEMVSPHEKVPEEINIDEHWAIVRTAIAKARGKTP